ncbi:MAG TPA: diaminopimelate decarboxylase [Candidatus Limnocylindrales bacterium]|nr:diaminopimelate decarboxylase [Candidatus Limnocylindrales bacterium]
MTDLIDAGDILPDTTRVVAGHLSIGGCDVTELAERFGTPLYVYDEASVLSRARAYRDALRASYPGMSTVCYAAKAYAAPWILSLLGDEGLGLDVVSGGELFVAAKAGFPRDRVYFHGNNKGEDELALALDERVGRIVVDNLDEIALLGRLAKERGVRQTILLRVSPGVDAHTHAHLTTGKVDTKFGLGIETGAAAEGVRAILAQPALSLRGYHAHIGSQINEIGPFEASITRLFAFAKEMHTRHGVALREISPGGGYGVRYTTADPKPNAIEMVRRVGALAAAAARSAGFDELPDLTIEPGRSIVAAAAVALYRVGSVKAIPAGRTYVAVDGGMSDNIRPTAYGAKYSAMLANRADDRAKPIDVAIAGKYCETGDILIGSVALPLPAVGDLLAIPVAGAYHLSMASNYNMAPRPAVVVVADGRARLVRRRETFDDLLAADIVADAVKA